MNLFTWQLIACCVLKMTQSASPNIFVIIVDDLGYGNIGFLQPNNTEINTPNIDHLANEGLILMRHYSHYVCSPTRSSFQSGRLPVHVQQGNSQGITNQYFGISINMTGIAEKLKAGNNYSTHMVGKWDAGMTAVEQMPLGRGYDSYLGYLSHDNDYFTDRIGGGSCHQSLTDLWENDHPAYNLNGTTYEEFMFAEKIYGLIDASAKLSAESRQPFFIVYTPHIAHSPLQVPKEYLLSFDNDENNCSFADKYVYPGFTNKTLFQCRSIITSMINLLDTIVGNITTKLKENNLYNDTLIVFTSDNGGQSQLNVTAGNNYPLRGAKFTPFEGGIRVPAFVSGGFLPEKRRGKKEYGMIHITDWYATFCKINDIDPTDRRAQANNLPPIDSVSVWDLIIGENETSPRFEIPVDKSTLINGKYKFIINTTVKYASWTSMIWPNATSTTHPIETVELDCHYNNTFGGCLFDVSVDMTEHHNIAEENGDIVKQMNERLIEVRKGYFKNNVSGSPSVCPQNVSVNECGCWTAINFYNGYIGPWQNLNVSTKG